MSNKKNDIAIPDLYAELDHPKKRLLLSALEKSFGIVAPACRAAKVSRGTHYHWLNNDSVYRKIYDETKDLRLDMLEQELYKRVKTSDALLIFALKTQGKERGYIERQENMNVNATIEVRTGDEPVPGDIPYEID